MGNHGTFSKVKMFEESMRIPLIMRFSGRIRSGLKLDVPATGVDILPTILDFAHIGIPAAIHGKSLKPTLTGDGEFDGGYAFREFRDSLAIRSKDWKLILNPSQLSNIKDRSMLYDLGKDPGEVDNLLSGANRNSKNLARAEELKKRIVEILEDLEVEGITIEACPSFEF